MVSHSTMSAATDQLIASRQLEAAGLRGAPHGPGIGVAAAAQIHVRRPLQSDFEQR